MKKIKGENLLFEAVGKFHAYLGKRKFVRNVIDKKDELTYEKVQQLWNDKKKLVQGDIMTNGQHYYSCVDEVMEFQETDNVVDIGCGEGTMDSFIHVNKLYGIDFSKSKLDEARKKNPKYTYHEQSFLDKIDPANHEIYNKCFSFSVFQYCKPEDADRLLQNSIDVVLKKTETTYGGVKMVAHIDVPDIEKAYLFYRYNYGISKTVFAKYKEEIKTIFYDGSYWHDMNALKEKCLKYLAEKAVEGIVYVGNSHYYYRSNLVILIYGNNFGL